MNKFFDKIIGDLNEKKEYKETEKRATSLPREYADAYKEIKRYIWNTSGIVSIEPLINLVDVLEEAAARNKRVVDVTGPDVAGFADELVRGEKSYYETQRSKLNAKFKN